VLVLLLATLWPPLQMEIRLTPSALRAPTKTKNLTDDFAARGATVAAFSLHTAAFRAVSIRPRAARTLLPSRPTAGA
jgi:hypothetical protein